MPPRKRAAAEPRKRATSKKASSVSLAVVSAGVVPAPGPVKPDPMTLDEAIESGDYLEILLAQRRQLAQDLKTAAGPAQAAMHRQFALLSKEIAGLEAAAKKEADEDAEGADAPDEEFNSEAL